MHEGETHSINGKSQMLVIERLKAETLIGFNGA